MRIANWTSPKHMDALYDSFAGFGFAVQLEFHNETELSVGKKPVSHKTDSDEVEDMLSKISDEQVVGSETLLQPMAASKGVAQMHVTKRARSLKEEHEQRVQSLTQQIKVYRSKVDSNKMRAQYISLARHCFNQYYETGDFTIKFRRGSTYLPANPGIVPSARRSITGG